MIGEDRTVMAFVWDATNGMRSVKAVLEAAGWPAGAIRRRVPPLVAQGSSVGGVSVRFPIL
jgi:hypothetical protein